MLTAFIFSCRLPPAPAVLAPAPAVYLLPSRTLSTAHCLALQWGHGWEGTPQINSLLHNLGCLSGGARHCPQCGLDPAKLAASRASGFWHHLLHGDHCRPGS
jgi:hypothetical protein